MKLKEKLKIGFGMFFSPLIWIFIIYIVFEFKRYPEIWTRENILLFLLISIPTSIILFFINGQNKNFVKDKKNGEKR